MLAKEVKFLLTNSTIYGLGAVVSQLAAFFLLPLYTRYLTPADYGIMEAITVSTGIIGIVITMGIFFALSRFYYESEEEKERKKAVSTSYIVYLAIACCFAPLLYFISGPLTNMLFKTEMYSDFFRISFGTLLLGGLIDIGLMYLRLIKKAFLFIIITTAQLLFLISLNVIFIVYLKQGVLGIFYSSLFVKCFFAIIMTASILWKTKIDFSLPVALEMIRFGLPTIFSNLGNTVVKQADKYFILHFLSLADMGIYSLAMKLGVAVHSLITMPFIAAYIPRRFEIMYKTGARGIYGRIFTYYVFFVTYIGLTLSIFLPDILHFMVTPQFMKAEVFVPGIIFSMILFGSHYHLDFGIQYSKKTKYFAYINVISGAVQIGLNYILISRYGIWGAVTSSVSVFGLQAYLLYSISNRHYHIPYEFSRILKYLLMTFIVYGVSRQISFHSSAFNIIIKAMLLIAFSLLVIRYLLSSEEKIKLKEMYNILLKRNESNVYVLPRTTSEKD